MDQSVAPNPTIVSRRRRRIFRPATLLIVILLGVGIFFALSYVRSTITISELKRAAAKSPDTQVNQLIRTLGKHMVLPDERPTIATVEDTKKLTGQTFFKNAHSGDKVFMYTKAKKAILYRPSEDKVIEVAYLNISK